MKTIFLDATSLTPVQLEKAINVSKKILLNDEENTTIVSFGYAALPIGKRWKLCSELGLQRFEVSRCTTSHKGIEVQEWLNHHDDVDHICIISHDDDLTPLENYRIKIPKFFLRRDIEKTLGKPYVNKTSKKAIKNSRKLF